MVLCCFGGCLLCVLCFLHVLVDLYKLNILVCDFLFLINDISFKRRKEKKRTKTRKDRKSNLYWSINDATVNCLGMMDSTNIFEVHVHVLQNTDSKQRPVVWAYNNCTSNRKSWYCDFSVSKVAISCTESVYLIDRKL